MEYQIIIPKEIGINSKTFVDAWNNESACCSLAVARYEENNIQDYNITDILMQGVPVLSCISVGIITNALYDKIKAIFSKKGINETFEIKEINSEKHYRTLIIIVRGNEDEDNTNN